MIARRRVPAVGRRRRGVVLPHLDLDGARLLRRAAPGRVVRLGRPALPPTAWVDAAARITFDYGYDGTGNWPFNTAYAANRDRARVRDPAALPARGRAVHQGRDPGGRLDRVRPRRARPGAPIGATDGHLVVIVGFTGDRRRRWSTTRPPADRRVRRTYDRGQFEHAWLHGSGGLAYVITRRRASTARRPPREQLVNRHVAWQAWSAFRGGAHDGTSAARRRPADRQPPAGAGDYDDPHRPAEAAGRFE